MTSSSFIEICFAVNVVFAYYDQIADKIISKIDVKQKHRSAVNHIALTIADIKLHNQKSIQDQLIRLREKLDNIFFTYKKKQNNIAHIGKKISLVMSIVCVVLLFSIDNDGSGLSKWWTWVLIVPLPGYWVVARFKWRATDKEMDRCINKFKDHYGQYIPAVDKDSLELKGLPQIIKEPKKSTEP